MKKIEEHNTLVFLVDIKANKRQIKGCGEKVVGCASSQSEHADPVSTLESESK
jgi:hypothetical protein